MSNSLHRKILFIWNYFYFLWEKGKSRFSDLADAIVDAGFDLEVVCSSFYHMGKSHRDASDPRVKELRYTVTFLNEPGYRKNVSVGRVWSMTHFNHALRCFLRAHDGADIVYLPFPPIKTAEIVNKWCHRSGAKLVLDIEDLWPESFRMLIKPAWLCSFLTAPLSFRANRVYRKADALIAVSSTYLNRALRVRKDAPPSLVAPIGADVEYVQSVIEKSIEPKPKGEFWLSYIGTLGSSYDLKTVIDACALLKNEGYTNLRFKIMGSGPDQQLLADYANRVGAPVEFLGLLPYEKMISILAASDVAINPIVPRSVASLINKVADYAAVGLPVINTQDCPEYSDMIFAFDAGLNVISPTPIELASAIRKFIKGEVRVDRQNVLLLATEKLSRLKSQTDIVALLSSAV